MKQRAQYLASILDDADDDNQFSDQPSVVQDTPRVSSEHLSNLRLRLSCGDSDSSVVTAKETSFKKLPVLPSIMYICIIWYILFKEKF